MPKLPVLSGKAVIDALGTPGFETLRQRGSRVTLRRGSVGCVVPPHREPDRGTLGSILKLVGVEADAFPVALK